jgi:hypothetical protein
MTGIYIAHFMRHINGNVLSSYICLYMKDLAILAIRRVFMLGS